jgi:glyoxylase-like metal-dependent hydrolase (beta-lactamase superfamily II)
MTDTYEIYAIRYGHHPRKASENFLGGDPHDAEMPLDYFVWAVVGEARTILVDTGFDETVGARRGRQTVKPVAEGLAAIGVDPASVETIIVSHLHYDHSGNYDLFPRARYHLQDREMEYATGRAMCHHAIRNSFEPDYVVAMVRKVFAGRVEFHDGDDLVAPGVSVHHIGGHTKGLQSVRVETRLGPVVVAADAAHLYAHLDGGRVFPTVYNVAETLEGYGRLRKLAASPKHVVPGHDPIVLKRYPAAKPGLEGWIVRLDAEPKG